MAKDGKISVQSLIDTLVDLGNTGPAAANKNKAAFDGFIESAKNLGAALAPEFNFIVAQLTKIFNLAVAGLNAINAQLAAGRAGALNRNITSAKAAITGGGLPFLQSPSAGLEQVTIGIRQLTPQQNKAGIQQNLNAIAQYSAVLQKIPPSTQQIIDRTQYLQGVLMKLRGQNEQALKNVPKTLLQTFIAPAQLPPSGGGAGKSSAAESAAQRRAEQAQKEIASAQSLLNLSQIQFNIDDKILAARAENNTVLITTRTAQKELATISNEIANVQANKELPDAAKKLQIANLELKAKGVSRQLAFDLASAEKEKAQNAASAMQKLLDEQALQQAKLNGNEAEVMLNQQIRDLKAQYPGLNEADVKTTLEKTNALKDQVAAAEQLKQVYTDVGMSIKSGVVDAIQGAISGTKSLQEVATNLLNSIANTLLNVAVNLALFGVMSGTGTGGGLLGGLFRPRAAGGPVTGGSPYIVGEKGPELFVPGRSGTIVPNSAMSGGSTNVVVNVDASGSNVQGDQTQAKQLGAAISIAVQAELVKQQRPRGLLAGTRR